MQCGSCRDQCPAGLDIPSYMRAYMYAYGYREPGRARETIGETAQSCGDCGECRVRCAMGFDIRGRVLDISRVRDVPEDFLTV